MYKSNNIDDEFAKGIKAKIFITKITRTGICTINIKGKFKPEEIIYQIKNESLSLYRLNERLREAVNYTIIERSNITNEFKVKLHFKNPSVISS